MNARNKCISPNFDKLKSLLSPPVIKLKNTEHNQKLDLDTFNVSVVPTLKQIHTTANVNRNLNSQNITHMKSNILNISTMHDMQGLYRTMYTCIVFWLYTNTHKINYLLQIQKSDEFLRADNRWYDWIKLVLVEIEMIRKSWSIAAVCSLLLFEKHASLVCF